MTLVSVDTTADVAASTSDAPVSRSFTPTRTLQNGSQTTKTGTNPFPALKFRSPKPPDAIGGSRWLLSTDADILPVRMRQQQQRRTKPANEPLPPISETKEINETSAKILQKDDIPLPPSPGCLARASTVCPLSPTPSVPATVLSVAGVSDLICPPLSLPMSAQRTEDDEEEEDEETDAPRTECRSLSRSPSAAAAAEDEEDVTKRSTPNTEEDGASDTVSSDSPVRLMKQQKKRSDDAWDDSGAEDEDGWRNQAGVGLHRRAFSLSNTEKEVERENDRDATRARAVAAAAEAAEREEEGICRFWLVGKCKRGSRCPFSHPKEATPFAGCLSGPVHNRRFKTSLCPMMRHGRCMREAGDCKYAHSLSELRGTPELWKTELCVFWQRGLCKAGSLCRHAHGDSDRRKRDFGDPVAVGPLSVSHSPSHSQKEMEKEKGGVGEEDVSTLCSFSTSAAKSGGLAVSSLSSSYSDETRGGSLRRSEERGRRGGRVSVALEREGEREWEAKAGDEGNCSWRRGLRGSVEDQSNTKDRQTERKTEAAGAEGETEIVKRTAHVVWFKTKTGGVRPVPLSALCKDQKW
uniref:C3H1-type domain-containing protein n=1 Tax=Chromera velia CCMP2878 TaxID=1169474 RepID=A0A0G4I9P1_9ALVE|eukprot:Cvel_12321.t1-p1 / transcript=Cvel_12321.t1 / gene=Cvel_12321 / organism=Chromera_velia_CCMP2878 / gene_product=hypothetical protein / transcript_product=hypothetical protein / location=Cvel_scaffold801:36433-39799(-) / protein_length=578 / sequence_SO=supercontig / SO=protein_coding / is_pseudo=false